MAGTEGGAVGGEDDGVDRRVSGDGFERGVSASIRAVDRALRAAGRFNVRVAMLSPSWRSRISFMMRLDSTRMA